MLSYCFKCRKDSECKNTKVTKIEKRKTNAFTKICGVFQFMKASRLLHSFEIKISLNQI